jgi:hypothetical protein
VRLERVDGLTLHVRGLDDVDGTPVLDLGPYLSLAEAVPDAATGWVGTDPNRRGAFASPPRQNGRSNCWPRPVTRVCAWDAARVSSLGLRPHAYRRIRALGDGLYSRAVRDWRLRFRVDAGARVVLMLDVFSGYRPAEPWDRRADDPALDIHRDVERRARGGGALAPG